MAEKFIPREKLSKKARKLADASVRRVWDCSPVPKIVESRKAYDRKKIAARCPKEDGVFIFGSAVEPDHPIWYTATSTSHIGRKHPYAYH